MDFSACENIVTQYLLGQDWQLVNGHTLGLALWQEAETRKLPAEERAQFFRVQIPLCYAVHLYEICRQPSHEYHPRAWNELSIWLFKNGQKIVADEAEREEIVQETLIEFERRLPTNPLQAPRALWAYLLKTMQNTRTDRHRRRSAIKRGEEATLYLEEMEKDNNTEEADAWQETIGTLQTAPRDTENQVTELEVRSRLQALFRKHLRSELQIQVAEAHFLDGLSPQEIAGLMHKLPHEVRLVKARIVQVLRNLPPDDHAELHNILAGSSHEKGGKDDA